MPLLELIVKNSGIDAIPRVALLVLVSYIVAIFIYQIAFHPFARYPGPFWAKFTNLYALYHSYHEDTHIDILRCHEKYGDFVRYGPDRLLVNRADALKDVFGHGKNFFKGEPYKPSILSTLSTFTTGDNKLHGRKRRIIAQGFSEAALRESQPYVVHHVDKLCAYLFKNSTSSETTKELDNSWTEPKNVGIWSTFMTMNVVSDLSFGRSFNLPEDSEMQYTLAARAGAGKRLALSFQCPSLFRPRMGRRWLDVGRWLAPAGEAGRTSIVALASQWVKDRIEAQEKGKDTRKDIISFVISAIDPDTNDKLGEAELVAEANGLIVAGGGTTSVGISGLFFYLSRNRHAYEKAAEEVRSSFSSLEEILTGPTLASCTYLHACVSESMRMSPPAPIAYYREAGSGGAVVSGHFIPQGLTCATGIYALHHNAAYFPEPFEFRPERWIPSKDNRPEQIQLAKSAYSPFSIGPRNCVAMPLANMEIVLLAARVLWLGDFRVACGPEGDLGAGHEGLGRGRERKGEFQLYEQFGSTKKGPVLQFRRREVVR